MTLTRNQRRIFSSQLSKKYKLGKKDALELHNAFLLLSEDKISSAVNKATELAEKKPNNIHPWTLLGEAALKILDAKMAAVFFNRIIEINPKYALGHAGLARAYLMKTEIKNFCFSCEEAIKLGIDDVSLIRLYIEIKEKMKDGKTAFYILEEYLKHNKRATELLKYMGYLSLNIEYFDSAAAYFREAYEQDKSEKENIINFHKSLFLEGDYEQARSFGESIYKEYKSDDTVVFLLNTYRVFGEYDKALKLFDSHIFERNRLMSEAKAIMVNIYLDKGDISKVNSLYQELVNDVDSSATNILKAYGVNLLGKRDIEKAKHYWAYRNSSYNNYISDILPQYTSDLGNIEGKLIVFGEQGMGDYFALLPLLNELDVSNDKIEVYTSGERATEALSLNKFGIKIFNQNSSKEVSISQKNDYYCYLGDFIEKINDNKAFGSFIVDINRTRYKDIFPNKTIGISWKTTNNYTRYYRSVNFRKLINSIPDDYIIVNLQYGNIDDEIKIMKEEFPQKTFYIDPSVDQMKDMKRFMEQVGSLERIITIDNTTAHIAGAIGHQNTEVLIPKGSECMWYWGVRDDFYDPWYGNLRLLRQTKIGSWDEQLGSLRFV